MSEFDELVKKLHELIAEIAPKFDELGRIRVRIAELMAKQEDEQPVQ